MGLRAKDKRGEMLGMYSSRGEVMGVVITR